MEMKGQEVQRENETLAHVSKHNHTAPTFTVPCTQPTNKAEQNKTKKRNPAFVNAGFVIN